MRSLAAGQPLLEKIVHKFQSVGHVKIQRLDGRVVIVKRRFGYAEAINNSSIAVF